MDTEYYWRLAIFANPSADVPTFTEAYGRFDDLRRELIFVHGLERAYVEHGLAIANSNPTDSPKTAVGFEFCKSRTLPGNAVVAPQTEIAWIAQITKVRRYLRA